MKGNIAAILVTLLCTGTFFFSNAQNVISQTGGNPPGDQPSGGNPPDGQPVGGNCDNCLVNPLKVDSITEFLLAIIEILLIFATPIIVIYIMYAGFLFVTARGAPGELEHARNALLYALIGGVIIVGARVIINIIQTTINQIR